MKKLNVMSMQENINKLAPLFRFSGFAQRDKTVAAIAAAAAAAAAR